MLYDLGVNGDYEGMYAWLDNQGDKECGSSVAYFQFTHEGDLPAALKSAIDGAGALNRRSRIYAIYKKDEKIFGRYLIGDTARVPLGRVSATGMKSKKTLATPNESGWSDWDRRGYGLEDDQ